MGLAERLRELRKGKKLTLAALAKEADVSKAYLWQLENEEDKQPSAEILYRIAAVLGATIADLLDKPVKVASLDKLELPESLEKFIQERGEALGIQEEDIRMLLPIKYRGLQPKTPDEWEFIFRSIKMTLDKR